MPLHAHRSKMMKYILRAASERSGSTSYTPADSGTATATVTATVTATTRSNELSLVPKVVVVSVASCLGVALLIIFGVCFYGRRRHKYNTKKSGLTFDKNDFEDPKKPELDEHLVADLTKLSSGALSSMRPHHYREWSSTSSASTSTDRTLGPQRQGNSPLRIANADEDEKISPPTLAFPKPVAEKGRPPRSKPAWLSPISTEDMVRSPPPAYAMSSAGQDILVPIPPQRPLQKSKATPMPPISPASRKSQASVRSKASTKSLVVPDQEPVPVISPARSESFAPKDLALPSPSTPSASSTSGSDSAGSHIGSSRVEHEKLPRLMSVVALFTPNLPDELHVKVGDAVRIIEEYKDGWCFVQFLGKKDAPKGVVPLVCLQERKRLVPFTHNVTNSSLTSLNWR